MLITRILNMHKTIFRQRSLSYWEEHINNCHSKDMDFTLDRVHKVAKLANLLKPKAKIITVAGTNGKGTSCAFLSQILIHYGKSVGVFSSPHLFKINERFFIIPAIETPILNIYNFEKFKSTWGIFNSRYRPLIFSVRFAWLRPVGRGDCPPVYASPDDKKAQENFQMR